MARTVPQTPSGTDEVYGAAVEDFYDYLKFSKGLDVANWVRFQFDDDDLVRVFFDCGEDEQVLHLSVAHGFLEASNRYHELRALWEATGIDSVEFPREHNRAALAHFSGTLEYTFAYAFFWIRKRADIPNAACG